MNEELLRLFDTLRMAQEAGATLDEVNEVIAGDAQLQAAGISTFEDLELAATRHEASERPQNAFESAGRSLLDLASFGFSDELMGGLAGVGAAVSGRGFGDAYHEHTAIARGALEGAREQHPIAAGVGTVAGAFVPGALPLRGAQGLANAGRAGMQLLPASVRGIAAPQAVKRFANPSAVPGPVRDLASRAGSRLGDAGRAVTSRLPRAARGAPTTIPRQIAADIPAAAAIGAAEGVAFGAGNREGGLGDRFTSESLLDAGFGATGGAVLAPLGSLWRVGQQRVTKSDIADLFEESLPPREGMDFGFGPRVLPGDTALRDVARRHAEDVITIRTSQWKPLEEAFEEVNKPKIFETIRDSHELKTTARRVLDSRTYDFIMKGPGEGRRPPSLQDLQEVASGVRVRTTDAFSRRRTKAAADELHRIMGDQLPGYSEARRLTARVEGLERAYSAGFDNVNRPVEDLRHMMDQLGTRAERDAFATGLSARIAHRLRNGGQVTRNEIIKLEEGNLRGVIDMVFKNADDAYDFIEQAKKLGQADVSGRKARSALRQLRFGTAVGLSAAAGTGGAAKVLGLIDF